MTTPPFIKDIGYRWGFLLRYCSIHRYTECWFNENYDLKIGHSTFCGDRFCNNSSGALLIAMFLVSMRITWNYDVKFSLMNVRFANTSLLAIYVPIAVTEKHIVLFCFKFRWYIFKFNYWIHSKYEINNQLFIYQKM